MGLFSKKKKVTERKWDYLNGASSWYDKFKVSKRSSKKKLSGEIIFSKGIVQGKSKGNRNTDIMAQIIAQSNNTHEMPYTHRKLPGLTSSLGYFTEVTFSKEKFLQDNPSILTITKEPELGDQKLFTEYMLSILVKEYSLDTKQAILDEYACSFEGSLTLLKIVEDRKQLPLPNTTGKIYVYNTTTNTKELSGYTDEANATVTIRYGNTTKQVSSTNHIFTLDISDTPLKENETVTVSYTERVTPPAIPHSHSYTSLPTIARRAIGTVYPIAASGYTFRSAREIKEEYRNKFLKLLKDTYHIDTEDPSIELSEADMSFVQITKRSPDPTEMASMTDEEKQEYLDDIAKDNKDYVYKEGYQQYRILAAYTWKGHTETKTISGEEKVVPKYETLEIIDHIPSMQAKYDELRDIANYYFLEAMTKDNHRKIIPIKDIVSYSLNGSTRIAYSTAKIPIWQDYGKYWDLTLIHTARKNKHYRRNPKNYQKKLYETFRSMDMGKASVDYLDIFHCFNLAPYLFLETRHHRAYQKYAETFTKFFDKVFKCYGQDTFVTRHIGVPMTDNQSGLYRLRGLKTIVNSNKVEKPYTFIGSHPAIGSNLVLYTYIPNYSVEEDSSGKRKILSYTLYALDISYWYGKQFVSVADISHINTDKISVIEPPTYTDSNYDIEDMESVKSEAIAIHKQIFEDSRYYYDMQKDISAYYQHEKFVQNVSGWDLSDMFRTPSGASQAFMSSAGTKPSDGYAFVIQPIRNAPTTGYIHNRFGELNSITLDPTRSEDTSPTKFSWSIQDSLTWQYRADLSNLEKTKQYNLDQFIEARKTKRVKWATSGIELTEAEKDSFENIIRNAPVVASSKIVPPLIGTQYHIGKVSWRDRRRAVAIATYKDVQTALKYRPLIVVKTHEVPVDPSKIVITSKGIIVDVPNFPEDRFEDTLWIREASYKYAGATVSCNITPVIRNGKRRIEYICNSESTSIYEGILVYNMYIPVANGQIYRSWVKDDVFSTTIGTSPSNTPRLPLKLWYQTPVYVQNVIVPSTLFYAMKYHYTIKKSTFLGKIFGFVLVIVGVVFAAFQQYWVAAPLISAGVAMIGAVYGIPWLQFIGMVAGIIISVVAPFYAPVTSAGATIASAYGTTAAVAVSTASLAAGAYQIATFSKNQKAIKAAKAEAEEKARQQDREAAEAKEKYAKDLEKITLEQFNINTAFEEQMDLFYWICYGGLLYDSRSQEMLNYNTEIAKSDNSQFDRFASTKVK